MTSLSHWIANTLGVSAEIQTRIAISLLVIVTVWLARRVVVAVRWRQTDDVRGRYHWQRVSTYVGSAVIAVLLIWIWLRGFGAVATYFGLLSAGVAIALRDPIVNFAAWAFVLWRRPFDVGDRIEIGDHRGDVIDIRIFQFSLLEIGNWVNADQSTGRVVHVPNGRVFSETVANYTRGFNFIWDELPVLVTFESNWRDAKAILETVVQEHLPSLSEAAQEEIRRAARRYMIFYSHLTPTVYTSVQDHGVMLTIRYLCEPRRRRGSAQLLWEAILDAFEDRSDIDFAYPTQRFFDHLTEGKPALAEHASRQSDPEVGDAGNRASDSSPLGR